MDIEFHYYMTYILARKAEFDSDTAYLIAYSSQYTDDNIFRYYVNFKDGDHYVNEITQTMDITKPSPTRQKIYPVFHFIPGGEESRHQTQFIDAAYHPLTTIPDSPNARAFFASALRSKDPYRIGIATHAYADTWSHQNFLGIKHKLNGKRGFGKIIPNIGHADFFHEPDKIHNVWKDERLKSRYAQIDNDRRFMAAAVSIFTFYWKSNHKGATVGQAQKKYYELQLDDKLRDAMDDTYFWGSDDKARIKAYKKICPELGYKRYQYNSKDWRYHVVEKREFEPDLFDRYWARDHFENSNWHRFQEAAKWYRNTFLRKLKPLYEKANLTIS